MLTYLTLPFSSKSRSFNISCANCSCTATPILETWQTLYNMPKYKFTLSLSLSLSLSPLSNFLRMMMLTSVHSSVGVLYNLPNLTISFVSVRGDS